jgi:hypothetical protein
MNSQTATSARSLAVLLGWAALTLPLQASDEARELNLPPLADEPAAGIRGRERIPELAGAGVYHLVYLPKDWTAEDMETGKRWPVIVEYTGNRALELGSTGRLEDAALGYGLSAGSSIWVTLPYVKEDRSGSAELWWGDLAATVEYAKLAIPALCSKYGGDPAQVILCGFSRGAIGVNMIGLHDDEIAKLWRGFVTHDHYDGVREWKGHTWGSPLERYQTEAKQRLNRIGNRPVLICQNRSTAAIEAYLEGRALLDNFKFLAVPVTDILGDFPNEVAIHQHTDRWLLRDSPARRAAWAWLAATLGQ